MTRPTISVVLCTYNGAAFLDDQLRSIAGQTLPPDELVVCDDGSTDESVDIITRFAAASRLDVHLVTNSQNLGPSQNFSQGAMRTTGSLIAFSDQDDVWYPNRIEVQAASLSRSQSAALCFSDADLIDDAGAPLGERLWAKFGFAPSSELVASEDLFERSIRSSAVTGATMMVRADVMRRLAPVPESWLHDQWVSLMTSALGYDAIALPVPLIQYRVHTGQAAGLPSGSSASTQRHLAGASIAQAVTAFEDLSERLTSVEADPRQRAAVRNKLAHLRRRSLIRSKRRLCRVPAILKELLSGRYDRFSNGWRSAVADVLPR